MKRDSFLKLTAASITGLATGFKFGNSSSAQTRKPLSNIENSDSLRKGFMLDTFPSRDEYSLMEKCSMLKMAGFNAVEPPSGLDRDEMIAAAKEHSLDVPSVVVSTHWANPLSSPDPAVREVGRKGVETALHDAKAYGASVILLVPGVVNEQVSYKDAYDRSRTEIEKLLPLAEELQIVIGIENVWNHFLLSPLEAAQYIDDFRSEWVGWYFDIGNIMNVGWPEQWIEILGDRIVMVHLKEFSRKKRDEEGLWNGFRVHYTEGDNNWEAIMASLKNTGYQGYAIAEPAWRGENLETMDFLREYVSQKMDEILGYF
jgi:hexulose-6-phosphate isomerase